MGVVTRESARVAREAEPGVRVIESPGLEADRAALQVLRDGIRGADLAAPAVALPDFHHKGDKEMPSSIAVATRSLGAFWIAGSGSTTRYATLARM